MQQQKHFPVSHHDSVTADDNGLTMPRLTSEEGAVGGCAHDKEEKSICAM